MVLSRDKLSQLPKIIISTSGVLFTAILLFISAIFLSACSSGSDTNTQVEETTSNKNHETSDLRTGTLTLTISIQQKLKKKKTSDLSVGHYESSFGQVLRLEQKVNIEQDFRYFETPPGPINSKERFRYFNTSPFWKIEGEEPNLSGNLKYESLLRHENPPRALGPLISETNIKGEAKPIRLKIESLKSSPIGNGLALRLSWDFLGSQTTSKYIKYQNGQETKKITTNDEKRIEVEDWLFSPMPNDVRINSYPFAYEYDGNPSLINAAKKNTENRVKLYQKLHDKGSDLIYFLGSVTHLEKNELTIKYKQSGRLIDQNHAFVFPAKPNLKSEIEVTLNIVAD